MIAHAQRVAGAEVLVRRIETRVAIRVAARGGSPGRWVAAGAAVRGGGRGDARVIAWRMNLGASARAVRGYAPGDPWYVPRPVFYMTVVFASEERATEAIMRRLARRLLADLGLDGHAALILAWRAGMDARVEILVNRVPPSAARDVWSAWPEAGLIEASLVAQAREAEAADPARGWRAERVAFAPRPRADAVSGRVAAGEQLGPARRSGMVAPPLSCISVADALAEIMEAQARVIGTRGGKPKARGR